MLGSTVLGTYFLPALKPLAKTKVAVAAPLPYLGNLQELFIDKAGLGDARQQLVERFTESNVTFGD